MYILALNGPPRSGKDTLANAIAASSRINIPTKVEHLSLPLRYIAFAMTGNSYHPGFDGEIYERFKQAIFREFDRTGRQLMIDVSESFLKPTYGQAVMAEMLIARNQNFSGLLILADSGFACEIKPLHDWCNTVPPERRRGPIETREFNRNFYVARIHRDKCDFKKDSREWVYADYDGDYQNDGTLTDIPALADKIIDDVERLGWDI